MDIGKRGAAAFVRWVENAPPGRLEKLDGIRARLIVAAIFRAMPHRFRGRAAGGLTAVIEWRVTEPDGGASVHTLTIRNGRCRARSGSLARPDLVIEITVADLLRLVTGVEKGPVLFATGRMRLRGDAGLALRLSLLFLIPTAQAPPRSRSSERPTR